MSRPAAAGAARRAEQCLFLLGFLTLFLELVLIRYLAGSVWNLGFFPKTPVSVTALRSSRLGALPSARQAKARMPWFWRVKWCVCQIQ
jgi:hypothetical protein